MKWLNEYFFGDESIIWSDGLWFYGAIVFIVLIVTLTFKFA